ncbi:MAG: hypothetical protein U0932_14635 [Thiobacillus sp.]|nr:hypothetical protein [Thiobacillus sp.]
MLRETTPNAHAVRRRKGDGAGSQEHAHRRAADDGEMARLHSRIDDHDRDIKQIIETQRVVAESIAGLTGPVGRLADVLETWNNVKGFWWTVKMLSSAAKVLVPLLLFAAALFAAFWLYAKTGQWEFRQ